MTTLGNEAELLEGLTVEGGWRVYSSGPGLILRLVTEGMLGLRWRFDGLERDAEFADVVLVAFELTFKVGVSA